MFTVTMNMRKEADTVTRSVDIIDMGEMNPANLPGLGVVARLVYTMCNDAERGLCESCDTIEIGTNDHNIAPLSEEIAEGIREMWRKW